MLSQRSGVTVQKVSGVKIKKKEEEEEEELRRRRRRRIKKWS